MILLNEESCCFLLPLQWGQNDTMFYSTPPLLPQNAVFRDTDSTSPTNNEPGTPTSTDEGCFDVIVDCGWRTLGTNWETTYRTTHMKRVGLLTFSLDIYWYLLSSSRRREGHKRAVDKSIDCHGEIISYWRTFIRKCSKVSRSNYVFVPTPESIK